MRTYTKNPVNKDDVYPTNNWGDIMIVDSSDSKNVMVRFVNTGNTQRSAASSIRHGYVTDRTERERLAEKSKVSKRLESIRNMEERKKSSSTKRISREKNAANVKIDKLMKPSIYGVGYLGVGKYKAYLYGSKPTQPYQIWKAMIRRCYGKNQQDCYGGCTVHESWHNLQVFAKWYDENYPKDAGNSVYQLDKDIKIRGNKEYSPEACQFVAQEANLSARVFR